MILVTALLLLVHTLSHFYQHWPPDQHVIHECHAVNAHSPADRHLHIMMADSQSPLDPKAPLSPTDLAKLLMQYCHDMIKEERVYTKELIDDKAELVITGMIRGMGEGLATIKESINDQSQKMESLELKLSYLERLLYQQMSDQAPKARSTSTRNCLVCIKNPNCNHSVQDQNSDSHFHCSACISVFPSVKDLYHHTCTPHAITSPCLCRNCDKTIVTEKQLEEHIDNMHTTKTYEAERHRPAPPAFFAKKLN